MSYFGVYILGFLFGASTTVLVQSLAITAELIDENTNTSAFDYGAMSLKIETKNSMESGTHGGQIFI